MNESSSIADSRMRSSSTKIFVGNPSADDTKFNTLTCLAICKIYFRLVADYLISDARRPVKRRRLYNRTKF